MTIGLGTMYYTFLENLALMLEVKVHFGYVDSHQGEQEVLEVSKKYESLREGSLKKTHPYLGRCPNRGGGLTESQPP